MPTPPGTSASTMPVMGAHAVSAHRLYAVAWVSGVIVTTWSIGMGLWILRNANRLFTSPVWASFVDFIGGDKRIPGWIILVGGILGVIGLITRSRAISFASCAVCIGWSGWITTFLWVASYHGSVGVGGGFALLVTLVFILRFWLLAVTPDPGEKGGEGW